MRTPVVVATLLLVTVLSGCARPIPTPSEIAVPGGLSQQAIEIALLSAVTTRPPPALFASRQLMSNEEFEQLVWNYYVITPRRLGWAVEARKPGEIIALIQRPTYHLRAAVTYDESVARVAIVDSSGLDQTADSIHRKARGWILKLESRMRTQLVQMARVNAAAASRGRVN
jgi:hypothetical protein